MKSIADMFREQYPDAYPLNAHKRIPKLVEMINKGEWARAEIARINNEAAVRSAFTRGAMAYERNKEE